MRKILYSLVLMFTLLFTINVNAYQEIDDTDQKVYDYANVLSSSEEEEFQTRAEEFKKKYNFDMVIVTVEEGYKSREIEAYADDFYDYNYFGVGDDHSGIIIAIDTYYSDENTYYVAIETTGKAIKRYNDAEIDKMFNKLGKTKYDGVYSMVDGFIDDSKKYYPNHTFMSWILAILLPAAAATVVLIILIEKNRTVKKATNATAYLDNGNINITRKEDRFITTNTTRVLISSSSGGRGGSSTHFGSSGISHGGGGRRV